MDTFSLFLESVSPTYNPLFPAEFQLPVTEPDINNRLESLCLSMTEHALGGECYHPHMLLHAWKSYQPSASTPWQELGGMRKTQEGKAEDREPHHTKHAPALHSSSFSER